MQEDRTEANPKQTQSALIAIGRSEVTSRFLRQVAFLAIDSNGEPLHLGLSGSSKALKYI